MSPSPGRDTLSVLGFFWWLSFVVGLGGGEGGCSLFGLVFGVFFLFVCFCQKYLQGSILLVSSSFHRKGQQNWNTCSFV